MQKGILFVISGPSGSGKGTLINEMKKKFDVGVSISATTRSPRIGETDGEHYYFLTRDVFLKFVKDGEMIEYNEYCENLYGTLKKEVDRLLSLHEIVILEVDVNGAKNVAKQFSCVRIFIVPPSLKILKLRLLNRKTENETCLQKRLEQACIEVKKAIDYDYVVINDDFNDAVFKLSSIIESEKQRSFRKSRFIKNFCEN